MKPLDSIVLRGVSIPTKLFLAPINTGFANKSIPTKEYSEFYIKRSGKGIGICYLGNIAVSQNCITNSSTIYLNNENRIVLKSLAQEIENNGSIPGIQLGCKISRIPSIRTWKNENVQGYMQQASAEITNYGNKVFEDIINEYIQSAIIAWELGYKVIQIHAAHGYFLSLLLSEAFNHRTDKYKGEYILLRIIDGIRTILPEIIIDIRISVYEGIYEKERELEYKEKLFSNLYKMDLDIISLSNGIYNIDKNLIYPTKNLKIPSCLNLGNYFAEKYPDIIWNIAGNLDDINIIENNARFNNLSFSIGRQLICDPYFILKQIGEIDAPVCYCINCGNCHYYSKGRSKIFNCNNSK